MILDSLSTINVNKLSEEVGAYYNLIFTIVSHKDERSFSSDSVINKTVNYYKVTDDYYNYDRALLYYGMIKNIINQYDTTGYYLFKEVEKVYDDNNLSDELILAKIYHNLGTICWINRLYERSLAYYEKALVIETKFNGSYNLFQINCGLFNNLLSLNRNEEAWEILQSLMNCQMTKEMELQLYDCMSNYYKQVGDINNSIKYKKLLLAECDKSELIPILYSIANSYYKLSEKDSALFYLNLLNEVVSKGNNSQKDRYYRVMSDMYYQLGNHILSKECSDSSFVAIEKKNEIRILEIEKQYDLYKKDAEIREIKQQTHIFIIFLSMSLILAILIIIVLIQVSNRRKAELDKGRIELEKSKIEKDNYELTSQILFVSCRAIPKIISKIDEVGKNMEALSPKESVIFAKIKKTLEKEYRHTINTFLLEVIIKHDSFNSEDCGMTVQEFIIDYLHSEHYTNQEIAYFFNTSQDAIRVALKRINAKKAQ